MGKSNYTKKKVKEGLENLFRERVYHFRIVDINLCSTTFCYYDAIVVCVETHCVYRVWKDKLDGSVSMCLMTVNKDSIPEIL